MLIPADETNTAASENYLLKAKPQQIDYRVVLLDWDGEGDPIYPTLVNNPACPNATGEASISNMGVMWRDDYGGLAPLTFTFDAENLPVDYSPFLPAWTRKGSIVAFAVALTADQLDGQVYGSPRIYIDPVPMDENGVFHINYDNIPMHKYSKVDGGKRLNEVSFYISLGCLEYTPVRQGR